MNTFLILTLLVVAVLWIFSSWRMRQQMTSYQQEIRRLHEQAGQQDQLSARHLNMLMDSVDQVMLRLDSQGRVVAANAAAMSLFRVGQHALPQPMNALYRDSDWQEAFGRVVVNGGALPDMAVSGRVLMPRLARMGEQDLLLLCLDITEKHRLEEQRRSFMVNLMHDLKTPLTSLLGYARSLQRFGDDADFRQEAIQVIADEAKHVNHLLESMLTLDQIEFAGTDPEASCDADAIVAQVCSMLKEPLQDKSIKLQCDVHEALPHLHMDMDSLERIVRNLLENAMHYAPVGGEVLLSLKQEGDMAHLLVQDDGPGIPEKHMQRVTERFYRVDKARSREYGGHGLGLAIVKELCEAHGGSASLSNRAPHGLSVSLTIPVVQS